MSICKKGLDAKLKSTSVTIFVSAKEPLLELANALDLNTIAELALKDLKKTAKGFWFLGRKLSLRVHLSVMILQSLLKQTDRGIESQINQTPVYQVFCGKGVLTKWKCPDHTKIEEFRNRLSPDTHKLIGHYVLQSAHAHGFADVSWMDIDSTVQEANMAYPSDATLMKKLAEKVRKALQFLKDKKKQYAPDLSIDIEKIRKKAQSYFFLARNTSIEKRRALFKEYHGLVKRELREAIKFFSQMSPGQLGALPWNIKLAINQLRGLGWRYLLDVDFFVRTNTIKPDKILSLHAHQVACIKKGKAGKDKEFGRVFQLGRIGGNFLIAFSCNSIRMEDKSSLLPAIHEHQEIFGATALKEVGSDKGYYKAKNVTEVQALSINADGLQRPITVINQLDAEAIKPLRHRRAGIEPLIQHAKSFGLGKSKMKSDTATLASGYRCVMGFNLHQLMRHMTKLARTN